QEEAKKVISIAVCDHYHHAMRAKAGKEEYEYAKQNVLLIGPTGVGKTYLVKCIARLIGVPFVKTDATKYSETGYVGRNVEDMVRELVQHAEGNIQLAQYGIIYVDEVDKIAAAFNVSGRDVSGAGVQRNLLKLMEETEVPLRDPMDMAGQLEAVMEFQQKGKIQPKMINTRHILFIVSGAFEELAEVVKRRTAARALGFAAEAEEAKKNFEYLQLAQTQDFIKYGLEPEFVGRLPVRVVCEELDEADFLDILTRSEGSILRQYQAGCASFGIDVDFTREGMAEIARRAQREGTGARGLITVCERVLRNFKYELPSTPVKKLTVDARLVRNPAAALKRLLKNHAPANGSSPVELVKRFEKRFLEEHGITLTLAPGAAKLLGKMAREAGTPADELCARILKDYPYGLKLLSQTTGEKTFTITKEALEKPNETLTAWITKALQDAPREKPSTS
ncbi:MAG: AAA family ATPase, partial [Candidatus Aureabacteria bacterium]|nr:AAA family ATPase [Candidatus Auribacterota bacterium]